MTPGLLRDALAARVPDRTWPHDPAELLLAVEEEANAHPGDPAWTRLLLVADDLAAGPPDLPGELRPREIVRADPISTTWLALDAEGRSWMVRAPKRHATPVQRRILERDRRALAGLVPGLRFDDGVLLAPAEGAPLVEAYIAPGEAVRLLSTVFTQLAAWREVGVSPGIPAAQELRWLEPESGRPALVLATLTPRTTDDGGLLRAVVARLPELEDGPVSQLVAGLKTLDAAPAEAEVLFRRALADSLGQRAIELRRRSIRADQDDRRGRLHRVVTRLFEALPPPSGDGPIGFDLEGQPTRVASDGASVSWGSETLDPLFADGRFDAPVARRFLRACATAPTRPDTGGDPRVTEHLGRWVSAGLKLRTVRLLLEKGG